MYIIPISPAQPGGGRDSGNSGSDIGIIKKQLTSHRCNHGLGSNLEEH